MTRPCRPDSWELIRPSCTVPGALCAADRDETPISTVAGTTTLVTDNNTGVKFTETATEAIPGTPGPVPGSTVQGHGPWAGGVIG
ncbi:hypothetical protein SCA03_11830 [Streptomyces cacaoi]|uniref:Uncharacterized protein n=1 Tax=Streptomyces cacaoi TaxID=1898 RepID=A0A4Y3QTT8_STRCI|nr:hypothetical protein SCA03_11830 [Streptomyces cacaoi]